MGARSTARTAQSCSAAGNIGARSIADRYGGTWLPRRPLSSQRAADANGTRTRTRHKSNLSTGKKKPQAANPVVTDPLKLAASTTSTADCAWSGAPKTTTTSATSDHS